MRQWIEARLPCPLRAPCRIRFHRQLKLNRLAIQGAFEAVNQSIEASWFHNSLAIQACAVDPERSVHWVRVCRNPQLAVSNARDVVDDYFRGLYATVRISCSQHVGAGGYVVQHRLGTVKSFGPSREFIQEVPPVTIMLIEPFAPPSTSKAASAMSSMSQ